jgi:hypothetical protein
MFVRDLYAYMIYTYPPMRAAVRVWVVDSNNVPVAGATVAGTWSGVATSGPVTGVTNAQGFAYIVSPDTYTSGTFVFTVTSLAKTGLTYAPTRNYETTVSIRTY